MRNIRDRILLKLMATKLHITRLTLDATYPKDPNPENWRTIEGAHVHLSNGKIDGGAGGKFKGNTWTGKKKYSLNKSKLHNYIGPKTVAEQEQIGWWMAPSREEMHKIGKVANELSRLSAEYIVTPSTQEQINRRIKGMYEGMYSPASGRGLLRSLKKIYRKETKGRILTLSHHLRIIVAIHLLYPRKGKPHIMN